MPTAEQALQAIAQHSFDPTLRQLLEQIVSQEQAGILASMSLKEQAATIATQGGRIADLEAKVSEQETVITAQAGRIAELEAENAALKSPPDVEAAAPEQDAAEDVPLDTPPARDDARPRTSPSVAKRVANGQLHAVNSVG